ncbi:flagellin [Comamonas sp. C11]|uniref:flagellin N-terminal helical domain-containing protein n=1 Tax=Comamonas sp. C11 TaxID=2966554 RepID=UPI002111E025|nr:flagellin [Comamonas sp. C11]UUC94252.1 flagellin [Comamonas sp. C11]
MAATINTNIISINAQRNLALSGGSLATSMQRLSSGLRVNSAKDDAAGLAIAERMNTQVRGLQVASRNANDGISLAQTAEGALGKVGDMLQRMRELAVQAGNATNSKSDREALQAEVGQLAAEIDRVAKQTNFNGQKLLEGSFAGAVFQVGANSGDNITLGALADTRSSQISSISYATADVRFDTSDKPTPAIASYDKAIPADSLSITVGGITTSLEEIAPANSSLERIGQVITAINNKSADTGVTAYMTMKDGTQEYEVSFMSSKVGADGKPADVQFQGFSAETSGIGGSISNAVPATDLAALNALAANIATPAPTTPPEAVSANNSAIAKFDDALAQMRRTNPALENAPTAAVPTAIGAYDGSKTGTTAAAVVTALTSANTGYETLVTARAAFDAVNPKDLTATTNYGTALNSYFGAGTFTPATPANLTADLAQITQVQAAKGTPSNLNLDSVDYKPNQRGVDDIDVTTQANAWVALKKIDSAIDQVNSARATLGAMQSRFENAVNNIDIQSENLSAARGRIVDADFAKETANLSRTQILQQAGTAMVAQANQIPQQVLQLLQK